MAAVDCRRGPRGGIRDRGRADRRDPSKALVAAETAVAAAPDAAAPRVWLAWALCANSEPAAAMMQLETARGLADAAAASGALGLYVDARAAHLAFERATGSAAMGAMPPLITAGDRAGHARRREGRRGVAVGRRRSAGLAGRGQRGDGRASRRDRACARARARCARARARVHRRRLSRRAARGQGGCAARGTRAVRGGVVADLGAPDADSFARDLADLDDPSGAVAAALAPPKPPVPATAKRSRGLKVL